MNLPATPPVLYVFAVPNGAGKSTLFAQLKQSDWLNTVDQVNGDVIYKENPQLTQDELAGIVAKVSKVFLRKAKVRVTTSLLRQ